VNPGERPGRTVRQLAAAIGSGCWGLDPDVAAGLHTDLTAVLLDGPHPFPRRKAHLMATPHKKVMQVTPEQAGVWLATVGPGYRPANRAMVARLAQLMDTGQWTPTVTDPILIDVTGRLRGGRMRLLAVQRHGAPVPMWVDISPPVLPHEAVPAAYVEIDVDGTPRDTVQIEAMRFDGGNIEAVRDWWAAQPGPVSAVVDDGHGWLRLLATDGPHSDLWAYPGDWIVRTAPHITYMSVPVSAFVRVFAPKR
jgi:hypothetical protein